MKGGKWKAYGNGLLPEGDSSFARPLHFVEECRRKCFDEQSLSKLEIHSGYDFGIFFHYHSKNSNFFMKFSFNSVIKFLKNRGNLRFITYKANSGKICMIVNPIFS